LQRAAEHLPKLGRVLVAVLGNGMRRRGVEDLVLAAGDGERAADLTGSRRAEPQMFIGAPVDPPPAGPLTRGRIQVSHMGERWPRAGWLRIGISGTGEWLARA
jgi:hypothetical protein